MGYIARKGKAVGDSEASVCTSFVGSLSPLEAGQGKGQGLHSKEGAVLASHSDMCLIISLLYSTLLGCIAFIFSMYRHVYYLYTTALISCMLSEPSMP